MAANQNSIQEQEQQRQFLQKVEQLQSRWREQEIRLKQLQESERELTVERAALAEEYRFLQQILKSLTSCSECQAPSMLSRSVPSSTREELSEAETARLQQENKRLRRALIELEELFQNHLVEK